MKTIARKDWEEIKDGVIVKHHKNDIYIENGTIGMVKDDTCTAQVLESVIKTVTGEVPLNKEFGIPYFASIFENNRSTDMWASEVRTAAKEVNGVAEIVSFEYNYDYQNQKLNYILKIRTDNGDIVEIKE